MTTLEIGENRSFMGGWSCGIIWGRLSVLLNGIELSRDKDVLCFFYICHRLNLGQLYSDIVEKIGFGKLRRFRFVIFQLYRQRFRSQPCQIFISLRSLTIWWALQKLIELRIAIKNSRKHLVSWEFRFLIPWFDDPDIGTKKLAAWLKPHLHIFCTFDALGNWVVGCRVVGQSLL